MKILLVSEGRHELGDNQNAGALEVLVRRIVGSGVELRVETDRVSSRAVRTHAGKGKGFFKRAVRWTLEASRRGYDALVLLIDEDRMNDRVRQLDDAQLCELVKLPRAIGLAIHTFDAWMLADETALASVLRCPVERQPDPESVRNAKERCRSLLEASGSPYSQSRLYADAAGKVDLRKLKERCPRGFKPFAARVSNLV